MIVLVYCPKEVTVELFMEIASRVPLYGAYSLFIAVIGIILIELTATTILFNAYLPKNLRIELQRIIVLHQFTLVLLTCLLMRAFIWKQPAFIPDVVSHSIALIGLHFILKAAKVTRRVHTFILPIVYANQTAEDHTPT